MDPWPAIAEHISACTGAPFAPSPPTGIGGGCINRTHLLEDGQQRWFVKTNRAGLLPMFEREFEGLTAIAQAVALRAPTPLCSGKTGDHCYLVMEFIPTARPLPHSQAEAGRRLAQLHRVTGRSYGWEQDNWIGSSPQPNTFDTDWVAFWRHQRMGFQLQLAATNGYCGRLQQLGERLLDALPHLLPATPPASLLHGDLWQGNLAYTDSGEAFVYDPAPYYGDRETDLAMTRLFGGFGDEFYAAYNEAWPLAAGHQVRRDLYNLYHVLNHLNLFGGGYLGQAESILQRLLSEAG